MNKNFCIILILTGFIYLISKYTLLKKNIEKFSNNPKIAILIICAKSERFNIEKKIWKKYANKFSNIDCYFIECNQNKEHFTNLKLNCKESYIPGIYQKSLKSLEKIGDKYDYYVRTNLSTFLIVPYLNSYVKKIPQDIPLLTGKCMKPKWASGTSIVLNKKGRDHLLTYGFKNVYYKNTSVPDDVLIGKVFNDFGMKCTSIRNSQTLFRWNYNNEFEINLQNIQRGEYPFIRLKVSKKKDIRKYKHTANKLFKIFYNN